VTRRKIASVRGCVAVVALVRQHGRREADAEHATSPARSQRSRPRLPPVEHQQGAQADPGLGIIENAGETPSSCRLARSPGGLRT